jgi:hypothetical protein
VKENLSWHDLSLKRQIINYKFLLVIRSFNNHQAVGQGFPINGCHSCRSRNPERRMKSSLDTRVRGYDGKEAYPNHSIF